MSNQRRKNREAREAAAAKARRAATEAAVEQGRRPDPRSGKAARTPVYRQRRFAPLPLRLKASLALGWLTVLALVLYLVPTWTGRLGFMVIATFALPLIVVLVRDPSRRKPR